MFLATQITQVHRDSGGVYGAHRVRAELQFGRQILVGHNAVAAIMRELGIKSVPRRRLPKGARVGNIACTDLVRRAFQRDRPDELWMTDITERPTREGKVYCCAVIDAFPRMVVGWSIDATQSSVLVTNAPGMATRRRDPAEGLVVHADRGVQFTSWAFSQRVREAGITQSIGAVGCPYDNAVVEAFWGRMQVELLNRNPGRPASSSPRRSTTTSDCSTTPDAATRPVGILSPTEFEDRYFTTHTAA